MSFQHHTLYTGLAFYDETQVKKAVLLSEKNEYEKERLSNLEILKTIIVSKNAREKCI
jgi:hypothetical protein